MTQPNFVDKTIWTGDNLDILRGMNSDNRMSKGPLSSAPPIKGGCSRYPGPGLWRRGVDRLQPTSR